MEGIRSNERSPFSPEKQELLALEAEQKYVFHGTGVDVEKLEPRQAVDTETGPDGEPAVFASDRADYAIFMAIVNHANCPSGARSRAGAFADATESGIKYRLDFGMSADTVAQLQEDAVGWVYVFDKQQFLPYKAKEGVEFVSNMHVAPIRKIRVAKRDLPEGIEVF